MTTLVVIIMCFFLFMIFLSLIIDPEKEKKKLREMGILGGVHGKYLGGLPDVAGGIKLYIMLKTDGLHFTFNENYKAIKKINYEDVLSVEIQSEHELRNQVSSGKIFMFGLAGTVGEDKLVVSNYVTMKINYNNTERTIVIQPTESYQNAQKMYDEMINAINEYETDYKNKNIETIENKTH
ncbi:hypothetical protein HAHI6034_05055 [Hathewaya histolytica]|uniref:Uncharacterized protein n=1 Tax=Hathewaya histolytica TaxID=1498 RepID=A0A4U9R790_HATHI|nr:hypothetical protein [Hathewaya histolytica]VTQ86916.1 Uncharacterised protein [Hathewaya histolytica]